MKLPITITYNSGETAQYIAQPPEWAKWERETKKHYFSSQRKTWNLGFNVFGLSRS